VPLGSAGTTTPNPEDATDEDATVQDANGAVIDHDDADRRSRAEHAGTGVLVSAVGAIVRDLECSHRLGRFQRRKDVALRSVRKT
jgi:hypothetical protein